MEDRESRAVPGGGSPPPPEEGKLPWEAADELPPAPGAADGPLPGWLTAGTEVPSFSNLALPPLPPPAESMPAPEWVPTENYPPSLPDLTRQRAAGRSGGEAALQTHHAERVAPAPPGLPAEPAPWEAFKTLHASNLPPGTPTLHRDDSADARGLDRPAKPWSATDTMRLPLGEAELAYPDAAPDAGPVVAPAVAPEPPAAVPEVLASAGRLLEDLIANIDREQGPGPRLSAPAEEPGPRRAPVAEERHVVFTLANTAYAVPLDNVTEIGRPPPATPLPQVPGWLNGVTNLRGDIVSLVDLRAFFGLETEGVAGRFLVARDRREGLTVGLLVDRVGGIRPVHPGRLAAPAAPLDGPVAPYVRGVAEDDGRMLVVLDLDRLLRSPTLRAFETV